MRRAILFALAMVVIATGCTEAEFQDAQVEAMDVTDLKHHPHTLKWNISRAPGEAKGAKVLRIVVSSRQDIVKFAKQSGFHVGYSAYRCSHQSEIGAELLTPSDVQINGQWLEGATYFPQPDLSKYRGPNGRIGYLVVVPIDGPEMRAIIGAQNKAMPLFDFTADLCIQLRGGKMWTGTQFSSPMLLVPHASLQQVRPR